MKSSFLIFMANSLKGRADMSVTEKLKTLPDLPGVYIMKDEKGKIIYIGKAKILKNRVRQYFHDSAGHDAKVAAMVSNIADFDYIVTDSEFEALCLESNLIKKNRPKYNILLKDDKHYPYLKITNEPYPKMLLVRRVESDGARYFGPYPGKDTVKRTMDAVKKIFRVQHCKKVFPRDIGKERPCLYFQMGKCQAPCSGNVEAHEYKKQFDEIGSFLSGSHEKLIKSMESDMAAAAEGLEFERAAQIRNKVSAVKRLSAEQKVISGNVRDIDIIAAAADVDCAVFRIFFVRGGKLLGEDLYRENAAVSLEEETLLEGFVRAYYDREVIVPPMVMFKCAGESAESLSEWLSQKHGRKVTVRNPQRGELRSLLEMAERNAKIALSNYKIELLTKQSNEKALQELGEALGMKESPRRIEAYDISNTSGRENVGSMAVFENGKPKKGDYKRFKIKYIVGSNDYDCMKEVLGRRFLRYHDKDSGFDSAPDLILIDGGAGHYNAAAEVLTALSIDIPVFGMVKDDRHRTRGLTGLGGEAALKPQSSAFRLVTFIQDEAHRFAVSYHKTLRSKKTFESELEGIKGVGEKRRKELMKHFKSVKRIKEASEAELAEVSGIDKKTAENIYKRFREK